MKRRDLLKSLLVAPLALLGWKRAKAEPQVVFSGFAHGLKSGQHIDCCGLTGSINGKRCVVTELDGTWHMVAIEC
jgi:hypothetical protein